MPSLMEKVWTEEEFMALPKDGHRYEVVKGELVGGQGYYTAI